MKITLYFVQFRSIHELDPEWIENDNEVFVTHLAALDHISIVQKSMGLLAEFRIVKRTVQTVGDDEVVG